MLRIIATASLSLLAAPALAQEVVAPPLPQPRPEGLGLERPDEDRLAETDESVIEEEDEAASGEIERVYQIACPALLSGRIIATHLPPVSEGTCRLQSPIEVTALVIGENRITLPGTPVTNCAVATALADWAEQVDAYAGAVLGQRIDSLATGPGYQCRLRNNAQTGFVSEHGLGNAIDISAITLADGMSISVIEDWSVAPLAEEQKFLSYAHGAACTQFTTVLGPEANSAHADHFHFDLGCHGQSCTARICE